jgi:Ni/Co efflux regulator RcnB
MRKLIATALLAAVAMPSVAVARDRDYVSRDELRRDRADIREEYREYRDARRYGDRDDIRKERREYNDARREYRDDVRDWREYRGRNPHVYRRGHWRSDHAYRRFDRGHRVHHGYYAPRYVINDPWRYRLPPAYGHTRWVRHYDDVLLIDMRTGRVRDVIRGFYW